MPESPAISEPSATVLAGLIDQELPAIRSFRRDLHAHPETGLLNPRTQRTILNRLDGLGLEIGTGDSCSSITATLRTGRPGNTVLLRADTDALPIPEETALSFASQQPDASHACGHDAHTAMLVGAARLLAGPLRAELTGIVRFAFQPGEEGHGGAERMLAEGLLSEPVNAALALHVNPNMPSGAVVTRPGPFFASCDLFKITLTGKGGHGSMPHLCDDPIAGAMALGTALLGMLPRQFAPESPVTLSLGVLHAGSAPGAIPGTAELQGTIRTFDPENRQQAWQRVETLAAAIAAAHGLTSTVELLYGCPPTVNTKAHAEDVLALAAKEFGPGRAVTLPSPVMAAEDFGAVLNHVPGTLVLIGACPPGQTASAAEPVHSSRMIIDEDCMATGIAIHVRAALAWTSALPS